MRLLFVLITFALPADPPLSDLAAFPPKCVTDDATAFASAYRSTLQSRRMLEPWRLELWREDADEGTAWTLLHDAQSDYYVAYRRRALGRLRDLLGPADYLHGRMPQVVPLWRFKLAE